MWVRSRRGKGAGARRWTSASTTAPCTHDLPVVDRRATGDPLHAPTANRARPKTSYSACQVEAIPDQAWARNVPCGALRRAEGAAGSRGRPAKPTARGPRFRPLRGEVADVVPAVPGGATEGGEAAGVEGIPRRVAGGVSGAAGVHRLPPPSRPRVRAARRPRWRAARCTRTARKRDARMNRFVVSDPSRCIGCSACPRHLHGKPSPPRPAARLAHLAREDAHGVGRRDVPSVRRRALHDGVCPEGPSYRSAIACTWTKAAALGCLLCALVCPFRGGVPVEALDRARQGEAAVRALRRRARLGCCARRRRSLRRW